MASIRKKKQFFFYETIKVQPTYAVSFYRSTNPDRKEKLLPKFNKHRGQVSLKAATKIRNSVNWMYLFSEPKFVYSKAEKSTFVFKLNFITLTLTEAQKHSDDYLKINLLVPFVQWLTKTQGAFMWLWKCESQANGNIHFHITTHQFVHWKSVRAKWNYLLQKNGYVKMFQDGTNDKGDAATQIKAAKNAKQVGSYLAKYIGKSDKWKVKPKNLKYMKLSTHKEKFRCSNVLITSPGSPFKRQINGRLWACSNNIANINCFISQIESDSCNMPTIREEISTIQNGYKKDDFYELAFYPNNSFKELPQTMKKYIEPFKPKNKQQTQFTVESLFG
jgi:hypothetical protein